MFHTILHKIENHLNQGITGEAQALYVMAQIRKSLEHKIITLQDDRIIKFYCDWVLHSHLKGSYAQSVLTQLNPAHDFYSSHSTDMELPVEIYAQIRSIISLDDFRRAMHEYVIQAGLPDGIVCIPANWHEFLRAYLGIIEDCPLEVRQDNADISIKKIIVNVSGSGAKHPNLPKHERYSFTVHWTFVGTESVSVIINNHFTIPEWALRMPSR